MCSQNIKISKWCHFRQFRTFVAVLDQAELLGTPIGPKGPPNSMKRSGLNRSRYRYYTESGLLLCILLVTFYGQNKPFWLFWPAISESGWASRNKAPFGVMLESTRLSYTQKQYTQLPANRTFKFLWLGCFPVPSVRLVRAGDARLLVSLLVFQAVHELHVGARQFGTAWAGLRLIHHHQQGDARLLRVLCGGLFVLSTGLGYSGPGAALAFMQVENGGPCGHPRCAFKVRGHVCPSSTVSLC